MANIINFNVGTVFSGQESKLFTPGWDVPQPYTPDEDKNYVFPVFSGDILAWLLYMKEPLYIFGPTGCGKTSCVKQIVRKLNYPVYEITGHNRLEFPEMVGHHTIQDGNMHFAYGPLALAMKHGGVFMINEIDLLDPATAAGLNSVLDGAPLTIPENGGEIIKAHPLFKFIATANSNGAGDQTGMYQGILRQNIAFLDRFVLVEAGYLTSDIETELVKKHTPALPEDLVSKMVKYANAVRKLFIGESAEGSDMTIELTMSTRTIIRWALLTVTYEPMKQHNVDVVSHALDRALLYRASGPTKKVLQELKQRIFG